MKTSRANKISAKTFPGHEAEAAMHGIWSGTISFSLVAIPVQLQRAVTSGRVSFHMLHKKDNSRLERKMFCPDEETLVAPEDIVRGYEIEPDKYIIISDEELESVSPERSRTIEITEFIDIKEIDPVYFDHPYYLVPEKGGEKAYRLLAEVMARSKKAGIAKFVLADREYLVAINSSEGALVLITLHYSGDVLPFDGISATGGHAADKEKSRIEKEIKKMMVEFEPEKYADSRRNKILALLDRKVKAKAVVESPASGEEEADGPADLVATLQEAMKKVKAR